MVCKYVLYALRGSFRIRRAFFASLIEFNKVRRDKKHRRVKRPSRSTERSFMGRYLHLLA